MCSIAELEQAPNLPGLLVEYAAESALSGMPQPVPQVETYRALEAAGIMQPLGAFRDSVLMGYCLLLSSVLPHYGVKVCTTESYFVAREYRHTGAGLKLLRLAEEYARETGAAGLLISAPVGGPLAELLPHVGYNNTNLIFFKGFAGV
jgi:GNAT superfamily N-acetyltransferase